LPSWSKKRTCFAWPVASGNCAKVFFAWLPINPGSGSTDVWDSATAVYGFRIVENRFDRDGTAGEPEYQDEDLTAHAAEGEEKPNGG
jgi:hypothetical protein